MDQNMLKFRNWLQKLSKIKKLSVSSATSNFQELFVMQFDSKSNWNKNLFLMEFNKKNKWDGGRNAPRANRVKLFGANMDLKIWFIY